MSTAVFGPGHVVAGRYRIEQLLGQGGMGSVYRAVQLSVGRTVALKLLMEEHDGSAALLERFQREALALARLTHEHTVRLFDFGSSERGRPFLVMEFLRGADLARDLERQGPLRYDHALQVTRQILYSLSEAHDAGIVHRDIKPGNVFLCAANVWPRVKVLDFGIVGGVAAEVAAPKLTRTGTVLGSAAYMSPEQAQGLSVGPVSDLYAVGVVLFEMLTQHTLFDARPLTAQLLAKVMERAPRLRDVRPELGVPHALEALVAELVERDPSRRPASARAVLERIDALLDQAALPPQVRAVADATARAAPAPIATLLGMPRPPTAVSPPAAAARGIAETEPMLVPPYDGDGWAPRPSGSFGAAPPARVRPRRRLRSMLGVLGVAALGALVLALRSALAEQAVAAALDQLAPTPPATTPMDPAPAETPRTDAAGGAPSTTSTGAATSSGETALSAIQQPVLAAEASGADGAHPIDEVDRLPLPAAEPPRAAPAKVAPSAKKPRVPPPAREPTAATSAPSRAPVSPPPAITAPAAATPAESTASSEPPHPVARPVAPPTSPSPEPTAEPPEPLAGTRRLERERSLSSIAAVEAAHQAGELSRAERNERIATLRLLRAAAQARAVRAYREGRIGRRELWLRRREIDREFVGELPYTPRRGRIRLMW